MGGIFIKKENNVQIVKKKKIGQIVNSKYSHGHIEYEIRLNPIEDKKDDDINPSSRYDGKERNTYKGAILAGNLPLVPELIWIEIMESMRKYGKWVAKKQDEYLNNLLEQNS